jgi:hypothetical protein
MIRKVSQPNSSKAMAEVIHEYTTRIAIPGPDAPEHQEDQVTINATNPIDALAEAHVAFQVGKGLRREAYAVVSHKRNGLTEYDIPPNNPDAFAIQGLLISRIRGYYDQWGARLLKKVKGSRSVPVLMAIKGEVKAETRVSDKIRKQIIQAVDERLKKVAVAV